MKLIRTLFILTMQLSVNLAGDIFLNFVLSAAVEVTMDLLNLGDRGESQVPDFGNFFQVFCSLLFRGFDASREGVVHPS